jgi:predicted dehydrogenase
MALPVDRPGAPSSRPPHERHLRVGVLGAGPIAQFAHFDALGKARNAELYAICDVAEDLLADMNAIHRPRRAFSNYGAMLADPDVDAVLIATADQFHVAAAREAIGAGKHVLVEKPLGANTAECLPLRDEVHASGLTLQVGTMRRFDPGIAFARDFVRDEIGEVIALKAWYCDSAYRYRMTDTLQPIPRLSGRARTPTGAPKSDRRRYSMLAHGSHLIDTAHFLLGQEIATVQADLVERAGVLCWFVGVRFAGGSVGHLDLTLSVQMDWHEGFHLYGEHGSVVAKSFLPWYHRATEVECFSSKDREYHRPLGEDAHAWRRQVEGFAHSVLTGAPQVGAGVDDGLAAMRVIDAIERSVETGAAVAVDPPPMPA